MDVWSKDVIDDPEKAMIEINGNVGKFNFICVNGFMDISKRGNRYEFTWDGNDECDSACGSGYFQIIKDTMIGLIKIHLGDESKFKALRIDKKIIKCRPTRRSTRAGIKS